MNYKLLGSPVLQYFQTTTESLIVPASGAKIEFLVAGDITTKNVYNWDGVQFVSLGNTIILDSEGYANQTGVWLEEGYYKIRLYLSDGVGGYESSPKFSVDNVEGAESSAGGLNSGVVSNVTELRNLSAGEYDIVTLLGYYEAGDGGGGVIEWNASSTSSDDNGMVFAVLTGGPTGRYIRRPVGNVMYEEFYGIMDRGSLYPMATRFNQMVDYVRSAQSYTKTIMCGAFNHWLMGVCLIDVDYGISIIFPDGFKIEGTITNSSSLTIESGNSALILGKSKITSASIYGVFRPQKACTDIRPEWWGAVGDAVTDDSYAIKNSVEYGSGFNRLIISASYEIPLNLGNLNELNPVIIFKENDSSYIRFTGSSVIYVRGFEGIQGLCVNGGDNIDFSNLPRNRLEISRVGVYSGSTLNQLTVSANSYGGNWTFVWDGLSVSFTSDYTDVGTSVFHEVMAGSELNIGSHSVSFYNINLPECNCISATTGHLNISNASSIKSIWFGGSTQSAVDSSEISGVELFGGNIQTSVTDLILGESGTFRGNNCHWNGNTVFRDNSVVLDKCTINSGSRSLNAIVCESDAQSVIADKCTITGRCQWQAKELSVRSCTINSDSIDIYSSPYLYRSSVFFNNRFVDANVKLRNYGTIIRDILVDTCIWVTSIASSPSQLTIVSDSADVEVRGVRIINPCEEFITGASRSDPVFATTLLEGSGTFSSDNSLHTIVIDKLNSANPSPGRACRRTHGNGQFVLDTTGVPGMNPVVDDWFSLPGVVQGWHMITGGTVSYYDTGWHLATIYPWPVSTLGSGTGFAAEYNMTTGSSVDDLMVGTFYGQRFRMNSNG